MVEQFTLELNDQHLWGWRQIFLNNYFLISWCDIYDLDSSVLILYDQGIYYDLFE